MGAVWPDLPEVSEVGTSASTDGVTVDGPTLQQLYTLAAELDVTILIHFREFPHYDDKTSCTAGATRYTP
jgi:hypothetical protein